MEAVKASPGQARQTTKSQLPQLLGLPENPNGATAAVTAVTKPVTASNSFGAQPDGLRSSASGFRWGSVVQKSASGNKWVP